MNSTQRRPSRGGASRSRHASSAPSPRRGGNSSRPRTGGGSHRNGGGRGSISGGGRRAPRKMPTFDPSSFINTNPVAYNEEVYVPQHSFSDFEIDTRIKQTIAEMGITVPTPIQDQTIPGSLQGRDVVGLAETGTGKTAAFLIPLIQRTLENNNHQTLILAPTRELAIQINDELRKLGKGLHLYSVTCVGGININPQIRDLRRAHHFVIGTPGRVLDLIKRGSIKPEVFQAVVLDEADRMLDMGFIHDMRAILERTPKNRHTLFFSATMGGATKALVQDFLNNPIMISVKKSDVTDSIEQNVVPYGHSNKFETLTDLVANVEFKRVIIFGSMKHSVEKLSKELVDHGIKAVSIHGNKSHPQRQRALNTFKSGNARVLVATDVAARGIHVDNVTHVINYDLPQSFDDYVHRIGRTGRGTERGKALTFIQQ
jgi:ATP-dependent RNA helicase RhlE